MKALRNYTLEACWVLCLVLLAAAPHRAAVLAQDWDDQSWFCPDCCNGDEECNEWCWCLLDLGSDR